MAEYRILSLDGGGPWAVLQVMALMDLYGDIPGRTVLRKFDLIAANSGGTLTLGGLIKDWPLSQIIAMFLNPALLGQIFVPATFLEDPVAHLTQIADFGPKYHTKDKYIGLRNILGADGDMAVAAVPAAIGPGYAERPPHVMFCAFDYDTNRETFFRSDTTSRAASMAPPAAASVAQAIHASANPPVNYFDAPAEFLNRRYWDGAVGATTIPSSPQ